MKTTFLPAIAMILFHTFPCVADINKEPVNYCKDPASWQQWHELLDKHSQDDAIYGFMLPGGDCVQW